jgi:hypothetical protein
MEFPQWNFNLYFMANISPELRASLPEPGTRARGAELPQQPCCFFYIGGSLFCGIPVG